MSKANACIYADVTLSVLVAWSTPRNFEYCMHRPLTCHYMHGILYVVKQIGGDKIRDSGATWSENALPMSDGSGVLDVEQQNKLSLVDGLLAHLEDLDSQMEDLKGKRDAVVTTIASLQGKNSPQTKTQPRTAMQSTPSPTLPDLTGLEVDLQGAPNLFERLVRIARAVDGNTINVTPSSEISSLGRRVQSRIQEFERGRRGGTEEAAPLVQENSSRNVRIHRIQRRRRRGGHTCRPNRGAMRNPKKIAPPPSKEREHIGGTRMNPQPDFNSMGSDHPRQVDATAKRRLRGMEIAATVQIGKNTAGYIVPSKSGNRFYLVKLDDTPSCTCPDFELRRQPCKHIWAVQFVIQREESPKEKPKARSHVPCRDWSAYNSGQFEEGRLFPTILSNYLKKRCGVDGGTR